MEDEFSTTCNNCGREVNNFHQNIHYTLTAQRSEQGAETIYLSCGCIIDFPDWQINGKTGQCKLVDYSGTLFITFMDDEMLMEDTEE